MATAAQIAEIRGYAGDLNSNDYAVTDEQIGTWYDASSSICGTAYKVAQWRLSKASQTVGSAGESLTQNPKVQQIKNLMESLRMDCAEALPLASAGYLNLGIDEETSLVDIE